MYTVKEMKTNEIIINKSKFISFIYNVNSINNVNDIINNLKSEYKDATHICYAYKIGTLKKAYDDKEPNHTAGMPILNVIEKNNLDNTLIVIVRYFGGIKLGAGNLLRTYLNSAKEVLEKAELKEITKEYKIRIEFDYKDINNINYILKDYKITYKEFDKNVIYEFIYNENNYPNNIDSYLVSKELLS